MNKRGIYGLVLIGLLVTSLMVGVLGVVSAAQNNAETLAGSFTSFFTDWSKGEVGRNIAKFIFFIIVVLFLYLVFSFLPFFEDRLGITFVFALLVGFLATAYLIPADVYSLLNSYNALGLTILTLIPLMVLVGISYRAFTTGSVTMVMLQLFAWGLFLIYSIYRLIYDLAVVNEGSHVTNIILLVSTIVAFIFFVGNRQIKKWVMKHYMDVVSDEAGKKWGAAIRTINKAAAAEERLAGIKRKKSVGGVGKGW